MLRRLMRGKFKNLEVENEMEFWQKLCGVSQGTSLDNMVYYLGSLGYEGTPGDMLRGWLESQGTAGNTETDNALAYAGSYSPDDYVRNTSQTVVTNEDGTTITTSDDIVNDSGTSVTNEDTTVITRE